MGNIRQINIENRTYYFFNDMISVKDFDSSLLKTDKKSYNIGDITIIKIDDYENVYSVNFLYLTIGKVIEHIKEKNGGKYLVFDSSDENKEVLNNVTKFGVGLEKKLRS